MTGQFRPEALLFDMDGLLLDTERAARDSFSEITEAFGIGKHAADAFFLTLVGTSSAVTREMVAAYVPLADMDAFGAAWEDAMSRRLADAVRLKPHVGEVLAGLASADIPMAVVTSTRGGRAREHLEKAGILACFCQVVGGDEVTATKPDPAPYLETAARIGVAPDRAAAFEDSDRGVTSAVAAGCKVVQVPDLRPPNVPFPALGQLHAATLKDAVGLFGLM